MKTYKNIEFEINEGVAIITLNRTDVLNSFNFEMADETIDALTYSRDEKIIRAIVLTANGKGFCAGQDLEEATRENGPNIEEIVEHTYNPIIGLIRSIEKPVVCAVNGVAAGAGANIAIACDITFAAESANFIQSFSNIGLVPDSGGTFFLPRLIGLQRATAMMFSGSKTSAIEAKEMARRLAREEGVFGGMSSGGAVAAALKLSETIEEGNIVCIICDRGDKYLSTDLFE